MLKEKGLVPRFEAARDIGPWRLTCTLPDNKEVVYTYDDLMANKPYPGLPFAAPLWGKRFEGKDGKAYFFSPLLGALGDITLSCRTPTLGDYVQNREPGSRPRRRHAARPHGVLLAECRSGPILQPSRGLHLEDVSAVGPFLRVRESRPAADRRIRPALLHGEGQPGTRRRGPSLHSLGRNTRGRHSVLDTYCLQYGLRGRWPIGGRTGTTTTTPRAWRGRRDSDGYEDYPALGRFHFQPHVGVSFPDGRLQDYLYPSVQRDGTTAIGSFSYAMAGGVDAAKLLQDFIKKAATRSTT